MPDPLPAWCPARSRSIRIVVSLDVFLRGAAARILAGDPLHLLALSWAGLCAGYILYTLRTLALRSPQRVSRSQVLACLFFCGSNGLADFKDYLWSMHYLHAVFLLAICGWAMVISAGIPLICPARCSRWAAVAVALLALLLPA